MSVPRIIGILNIKNNNNYTVPEYKTNNNITNSEYKKKNIEILYQIKVLNSALIQNNTLYKNYTKLFSNNINYSKNIEKILRNKIHIANLSLNNEITILFKMINIVNIHPYNYSKFFKINNYYIPKISSHKKENNLITENKIILILLI